MTSQKVMLIALMLAACGCTYMELRAGGPHLGSPYPTRRVWAVLPLRNESGSQFADGLKMADRLAAEIDSIPNMDAIPVNRVLAALAAMKLREVSNTSQALGLMKALGVDGLVAGTITAYEPYDPPAMGLALELYADADVEKSDFANLSPLTTAATGETVDLKLEAWQLKQPVSRVSAHLAASEPAIRVELKNYAGGRGVEYGLQSDWRRYRINMNLFSDFAAHAMMGRLLHAESLRIAELKLTKKPPLPDGPSPPYRERPRERVVRRNSSSQPSDGDSAPQGSNPNHAPAQTPPQVVLVKDGQRFVFQCAPGDESALLANLAKMAQDPKAGLNWFDAAVLSHQVGQHMRQQLKQMLKA